MKFEFHADFPSDVENSARFYDERVPGLGDDFTKEVWQAVQGLKSNPELWRKVYRDIRSVRLKRFKEHSLRYRFIQKTSTIRILGVFHAKRHPDRDTDRT